MNVQLEALGLAALVLLAAQATEWALRRRSKKLVGQQGWAKGHPYILYFTGEHCTVCRTHQEPALRRLAGVEVQRVDALGEPELAKQFLVYTLPTTIVLDGHGTVRAVNYGYANASKLEGQLAAAKTKPTQAGR